MHRHVPNLKPRVSHLDQRQRNHPDKVETRRNDGGNPSCQHIFACILSFQLRAEMLRIFMLDASFCQYESGEGKNIEK